MSKGCLGDDHLLWMSDDRIIREGGGGTRWTKYMFWSATLFCIIVCYGLSGVWASWDIYLHADVFARWLPTPSASDGVV